MKTPLMTAAGIVIGIIIGMYMGIYHLYAWPSESPARLDRQSCGSSISQLMYEGSELRSKVVQLERGASFLQVGCPYY